MSDICPNCKSPFYVNGECAHCDGYFTPAQPQSELDALRARVAELENALREQYAVKEWQFDKLSEFSAENARLRNLLRDVLASADSTEVNQIDYIVGSKAIDAVREALGDE